MLFFYFQLLKVKITIDAGHAKAPLVNDVYFLRSYQ
jgi:hypothetical protein